MLILNVVQKSFRVLNFISADLSAKLGIELLFWARKTRRSDNEKKFWLSGKEHLFKSGNKGRSFGNGQKIAWVVHGWQSRGSRFQKLIENLVENNFTVIAWEGPAHGDNEGQRTHLHSFSKNLYLDIQSSTLKPEILIGHSFGGAAAAYVCHLGAPIKKLVLLSAPGSALGVFQRYWDLIGLSQKSQNIFLSKVEKEIQIKLDQLSSENFITELQQEILVIHDENDQIVPFNDALKLKKLNEKIKLFTTEKLGHHRIINNEIVIQEICNLGMS